MNRVTWTFAGHLLALTFGLAGILIAMPHPELWAGHPALVTVYTFGIQHGGATHIIFGAGTMALFGIYTIGWRRTLIFVAAGTLIPLCAELLGTATGWPFGGYSYTGYLGTRIAGRVPYSVPLSWFYMGFASYLLALTILSARERRARPWQSILLGAWLLTAWDLVLDPAMASAQLQAHTGLQFWIWHEHGAYFGMPIRNLAGWLGTGILFMTVSRLLWRVEPDPRRIPIWLPLGVYGANLIWAVALACSVGLWQAALLAIALGMVPASLAWRALKGGPDPRQAFAGGGRCLSERT
ncbi:MAG TPA: carotenoid biosynthesis protein [Chloroflexota bacterium]|nr:carotenoid biosynthesis protein [Chloroflexota bacterium]